MKTRKSIPVYLIIGLLFLICYSCNKQEEPYEKLLLFPILSTTNVSSIGTDTAVAGGNILAANELISRGVCWSNMHVPTIDDSKTTDGETIGGYASVMRGLSPATVYFVRAYATNKKGTSYGVIKIFATKQGSVSTVTDIDGNIYHTVNIGTQIWMVENFKASRYRNGENITNITDSLQWVNNQTEPAYCDYNNNPSNSQVFGRLYNWYAATDSRNIAPAGWHVPSFDDWDNLIHFLRIYDKRCDFIGGLLKEADNSHWLNIALCTENTIGFEAFPGGARNYNGPFSGLGYYGCWWSTGFSYQGVEFGDARKIEADYCSFSQYQWYRTNGLSVRCIKD